MEKENGVESWNQMSDKVAIYDLFVEFKIYEFEKVFN